MVKIFALNIFVIGLTVTIHYEFLRQLTRLLPRVAFPHRSRIVLGVLGALTAHAVEVWVFAGAFYFMNHAEGWGYLAGNFDGSLLDCVYYSFTAYTTLGTGDIEPFGSLRFLVGLEALTGLVLITWSASFFYLEMTRFWGDR